VISAIYPNPSTSRVSVEYRLDRPGLVRAIVHDILGREVATIVDRAQTVGIHKADWTPDDGLAGGLYLLSVEVISPDGSVVSDSRTITVAP
jgi:hypothetical protein